MKNIIFSAILLCSFRMNAQELPINWSETTSYDHLTTGYFDGFIGDKDNLIYSLWTDGSDLGNFYEGVKIVGVDKNSLAVTNEFIISGFGAGLGDAEQGKYYRFRKLVVREDEFVIFYSYVKDGIVTHYLQRVDMSLNPNGESIQFYQFNEEDYKGEIDSSPELVFGGSDMSVFAIAKQINAYGEFSKTSMKFFDFNGDLMEEQLVEVPVTTERKKRPNWFRYTLRNDNYYSIIYSTIETYLDKKGKEKEKRNSYSMLVNRETGQTQPIEMSDGNTDFTSVIINIDGDILDMKGIYASIKDANGKALAEGFFNRVIDLKNSTVLKDERLPFGQDFIEQLKPANGKALKKSEQDPLANLTIASTRRLDDKWLVFATSFRAWSTTACDSRGNCHTTNYEEEKGLYVFEVENDFSGLKSAVLNRYNIYVNKRSKDMEPVRLADGRILIALDIHKRTTSPFDKKTKYVPNEYRKEMWTYAIYEKDGSLSYQSTRLNQPDTPDERIYKIDPANIYQTNEGIFFLSDARKMERKGLMLDLPHYDRFKRKAPYVGVFSWGKLEQ